MENDPIDAQHERDEESEEEESEDSCSDNSLTSENGIKNGIESIEENASSVKPVKRLPKCVECGKSFKYQSLLRKHERVHLKGLFSSFFVS